jgi:hypothetical protein
MLGSRVLPSYFVAAFAVATLLAVTSGSAGAERIKGSGTIKTETRSVSGFHGIAVDVPANVTLRQGTTEGLTLTTDDNIAPLVETVVENGALKIRWARKNLSLDIKRLEIVIDAKTIDALAVRGSGQLRAPSLKAGALNVAVEGSGQMALDALEATSLKVAIRGDGELTTAGRVETLDVAISGSGEIHAAKLESRRVQLALNGSAQATVWAKDDLVATIAGSGEVSYYGNPKITQTVAGSGRIVAAKSS